MLAAANSCCIFSACNFDVATIDDECTHFVSSDAGFLICSSCDDEFTWSFDSESTAFFELYAVAANECGAFSQDELGVALDVEGLPVTVNIFCYDVCPVKQFEVDGSPVNPPVIDDSGVCDGEGYGLLSFVAALAGDGDGGVAWLCIVGVGDAVVDVLEEWLAAKSDVALRRDGVGGEVVLLLDARNLAGEVIGIAVGSRYLLVNLAFGYGGLNLAGSGDGADQVGRANLGIHVEAVVDVTGSTMQSDGVHGGDVIVGSFLEAVDEHRVAGVAPAPDAADVGAWGAYAVDGAGKDAVLDGCVRVLAVAYDAAGVVAADVERSRDGAVFYEVGRVGKAHDACRVIAGGRDSAGYGKVLDGGSIDEVEGCHALLVPARAGGPAVEVGRQRLAIAEEGAAEGTHAVGELLAQAHRLRDGDVVFQLHVLSVKVVALAHVVGKGVPVLSILDKVGIALRAFVGR